MNDPAQELSELRGVVREAAHELNNLLAAMTGYAEFLLDDLPANSQEHGFAAKIMQGQTSAKAHVARLLKAGRGG